jgi:hypothetical protein
MGTVDSVENSSRNPGTLSRRMIYVIVPMKKLHSFLGSEYDLT